VLDLTESPPAILRPGVIHAESLAAVVGQVRNLKGGARIGTLLRSPGLLKKHYAPRARLWVLNWKDEPDLKAQLAALQVSPALCHVIAHTRIPSDVDLANVCVIPHDPVAFARAIYGELHRSDEAGAKWIVVEAPPDLPEWSAIADRLQRAAA
jgi:L-threonylcarbamoyladenylate synthase